MTINTYIVGAAYKKVADTADAAVAVQSIGTAGLRVATGADDATPDADADSLLLRHGDEPMTRADFLTGAVYVKSALQYRAGEAAVAT